MNCATCDVALPPRTGRGRPATYCSITCRQAAATRHTYNKTGKTIRRPCAKCGQLRPTAARSRDGLICHSCRKIHREQYGPDYAEQRRAQGREYQRNRRQLGLALSPGNHRARAKRYGVEYEYVDRLRVFRRDRWCCGICHEPVDKRLKYPHPRSASLDHVIPMARGGGHTYANTQCSHWECNLLKLAGGGGEQLALIG